MKQVTILGGGITGLSACFHLARRWPHIPITLLERTGRLGGWIRSEKVQVDDKNFVTLEGGPRTLRPNSKALLELINLLDLKQSLITTPKTSPAAKARFLLLPPPQGLTQLPSSLRTLLTSNLNFTLVRAGLTDLFRSRNRPSASDESVEDFLSRRFGSSFAQTFGSALVHGIYAADSRDVSVRSAFGALWDAETRGNGRVVVGMMRSSTPAEQKNGYSVGNVDKSLEGVSVFSFDKGMETLTRRLTSVLSNCPNVIVQTGVHIDSLHPQANGEQVLKMSSKTGESYEATHVISTIPLPSLHKMVSQQPLPHLLHNPYVNVTVVSFVFAAPPNTLHPPGFGYLIPRPREGYTRDNPGILGTVFDSCSLSAQDSAPEKYTKFTVMLGGPHISASLPDTQDLLQHISRHLGRPLPTPVHTSVHKWDGCIPTPLVGHRDRVVELRDILRTSPWNGKLELAGAGVDGVSVGDCVEAGRAVAQRLQDNP